MAFSQNGEDIEWDISREIALDESLRATSDSQYGIFASSEDKLIHSDEQAIVAVVYNSEGSQIHELGARGSGSFEYTAIMDMYASGDSIHVFPEDGRHIIFRNDGEEIDEHQVFGDNYRHLRNYNEDYVALPSNPDDDTGLYYITRQVIGDNERESIGNASPEDQWLRTVPYAGGIELHREYVYWINPGTPEIFRYNGNSGETESFEISEPEHWRGVSMEAGADEIQQNPGILQNFIETRSVINGLYRVNGAWLIEIAHNHRESLELKFVNDEFLSLGSVELPSGFMDHYGRRIRMVDTNGVYFYRQRITDDGQIEKNLTQWQVSW